MSSLKKILATIFLAVLTLATPATAAGLWEPATITRISVNSVGVAFLELDPGAPNTGYAKAACSNNGLWEVAFDASTPAGQAMLSLALSAHLAKKPVRVVGSGTCSANAGVEGIFYLDILPD
ncbi:hypothetical protein GCM10009096_00650 [Parasphingorhabdus litoris]|uniref:Uncharacterized protein n=1 Tax=Parasphingorhabdus litoris TaxID=394733 RepID=A0ABN0ZZR3_9SPHN|nr:hypothetical protein [Parasphingorhabdus litoris]